MFNLVRDDFDENSEDILNSINKMLEQNKELKEERKTTIKICGGLENGEIICNRWNRWKWKTNTI